MTRDHPTNPTSQRVINKPTSNHHNYHHPHPTKVIQFKPFCLFSQDDNSLKQAVDLVESASLNRFRVCVVSVISKDSLDESVKDYLIQSLFSSNANSTSSDTIGNNNKRKQKIKSNKSSTEVKVSEDKLLKDRSTVTNLTNDCRDSTLDDDFENQVVGRVDSNNGVIVLNLTSFLETDKLCSLKQLVAGLGDDYQQGEQPILSDSWPKWNQNLIKTMLILLIVSHVIVFYNTEPSVDYSLIQVFKILETLRLKSQTRVTDLLESIASKQMFSSQWIRQGRVSCPRALFVCDTTYLNIPLAQNDVLSLKRDLEDQIYKLLKKTGIISNTSNSLNSTSLFCLPERDDFVFVVTRQDLQYGYNTCRFDRVGIKLIKKQKKEDFYAEFFESLQIGKLSGESDVVNCNDLQDASVSMTPEPSEESQSESRTSSAKANPTPQNRFRKFLYKHISNIQATAQAEYDNKHHYGPTRQVNLLLPRYDDFFTVLTCLKNLLFPQPDCPETSEGISESICKPDCWSEPDERRFVDIYDLTNTEELFSELHCYKTRLAAFEFYLRDLQVACPTLSVHEHSREAAKKLYLNHARGSACSNQLKRLSEQCQHYWQNLDHSKFQGDDAKSIRQFRGSNYSRSFAALASVPRSNSASPNGHAMNSRTRPNLSILRRGNGIKMMTCCDCGNRSNYMITPVDRKKKLERVDIHRLNE